MNSRKRRNSLMKMVMKLMMKRKVNSTKNQDTKREVARRKDTTSLPNIMIVSARKDQARKDLTIMMMLDTR